VLAAAVCLFVVPCGAAAPPQAPPRALVDKVDALVARAYETAASGLPCRIKGRSKPKILRWEEVDRCLNEAAGRVDWEALKGELQELRKGFRGVPGPEIDAAVDSALSAHALAYDRVFSVKDAEVLLPLTNSLLKYLPADSLQGLAVSDRAGTKVGTFLGAYAYERVGGLSSANPYRLSLFQYTDERGNPQSVSEKLLLDSFGVPWKEAAAQRGFRLPPERLGLLPHN
jgi:hypothetical protein